VIAQSVLLLALGGGNVWANEPNRGIVVTGTRLSKEELKTRAANYVRALGVAPGQQPAARWIDPICPKVLGLEVKLARFIADRIRTRANAAGARVADERCRGNMLISFSGDAGAVARSLAKRKPSSFSEVKLRDKPDLLNGGAPVRWWYSTEVRGRDGNPLGDSEPPFITSGDSFGKVLPGPGHYLSLHSNSIVSTQTVRALVSATVLIDVTKATGVRLDSLADYVALVALAEIQPRNKLVSASILGLFGPVESPGQLTDWDVRFLHGLYHLPLDRRARQHRGALTASLLKEK
jgi:hypothetical protein